MLAGGCFSDPPPSTTGGEEASSSGSAATSTGTGSNGETSGGSSSGAADGTSSAEGSTGETTGACECVSPPLGWLGPFEVHAGANTPLPPCADGTPPVWQGRGEPDLGECECECGPVEGTCQGEFGIGATCDGPVAGLESPECEQYDGPDAPNLQVNVVELEVVDASCSNPVPPAPTFGTFVQACAPTLEACGGSGLCAPTSKDPGTRLCVAMEGIGDVPECPAPFMERRVVAEGAMAGTLSCEGCGCTAAVASCEGVVSVFADEECKDALGKPVDAVVGSCESTSIDLIDVASYRYDASLTGTCVGSPEPVPVSGQPAWVGARTFCCL